MINLPLLISIGLTSLKLLKFWSNWGFMGAKLGTYLFSHFSQFLARNGSFFLASREKSKTREMCMSNNTVLQGKHAFISNETT